MSESSRKKNAIIVTAGLFVVLLLVLFMTVTIQQAYGSHLLGADQRAENGASLQTTSSNATTTFVSVIPKTTMYQSYVFTRNNSLLSTPISGNALLRFINNYTSSSNTSSVNLPPGIALSISTNETVLHFISINYSNIETSELLFFGNVTSQNLSSGTTVTYQSWGFDFVIGSAHLPSFLSGFEALLAPYGVKLTEGNGGFSGGSFDS